MVLYERTTINITINHGVAEEIRNIHKTIRILKPVAVNQANVALYFAKDHYKNNIYKLTGKTYNLLDGKLQTTELPSGEFYKSKLVGDNYEISFALPDVRVGSIIDYSFNIVSPFYYHLPVWEIQSELPKLITEYSLSYPPQFDFMSILHVKPTLKEFNNAEDAIEAPEQFCQFKESFANSGGNAFTLLVRKNVPAMVKEHYVFNINNYKEYVDFQMVKNMATDFVFLDSWEKYNEEMLKIGIVKSIRRNNKFLSDTVKAIINGQTNKAAIAKEIFCYVRNNFYADGAAAKLKDASLKDVFYERKGSKGSINAVLAAMLNVAGLEASLMATSTSNEIPASAVYPIENRLNYYACALKTDTGYIFLDATDKSMPFGLLPGNCYDGYCRIISDEGDSRNLSPDMIQDVNDHFMDIDMSADTETTISYTHKMGMYSSANCRRQMGGPGFSIDPILSKIVSALDDNAVITGHQLINTNLPDTSLVLIITYKLKKRPDNSGEFLSSAYIKNFPKNPLPAVSRIHPVEYTCRSVTKFHITIKLPRGYDLLSNPAPTNISLGENDMVYIKNSSWHPGSDLFEIDFTCSRNRATFEPQDYGLLRSFYEDVSREENKVIEFKKK